MNHFGGEPYRHFYVGKKPRHFIIEEHVLQRQCVMFHELKGRSWQAQDDIFRSMEPDIIREPNNYLCLPNTDPDIFQRLCDFLYQGVIPVVTPSWIMEQKLYRLADLLGAHYLMNGLVDALQIHHLETDTHFSIDQVRSLSVELNGSGVWKYGVMGIAYQLFHGLYAQEDRSFDLMCQDYPEIADCVILEVKQNVRDFHAGMDYRQHGWGNELGCGVCKFHVHLGSQRCQREHYEPNRHAKQSNAHFLGRYPVESKAGIKSETNTSAGSLESRITPRPRIQMSGAAKRKERRLAAERGAAKTMLKIRKVRMPKRVRG